MTDYLFTLLLLLIIILIFICKCIINRIVFVNHFRNIPGPFSIPIFGNALQLTGTQAEFFKLLQQYSDKYDGMFRLWVGLKPFVFLHKAEAVQPLLSSGVHINKSLEYKVLDAYLGSGLVTSSGDHWQSKRKTLTPVFHYEILQDYLSPVIEESFVLVSQLADQLGKGSFDIVPYIKLAAMDIICNTTLGYQLNSQKNMNMEYVKAVEEITGIAQRRFITPWLKSDLLFRCSAYAKRQEKCMEIVNSFSTKVIEQKRILRQGKGEGINNISRGKRGKVFLDLLLDISKDNMESESAMKTLRDEVNTFIFAGHDSVAATVSWCIYVFGHHPEVQDNIVSEIAEHLPNFGNEPLTVRDISLLEYLECCVKEVQRLYPAVPLVARHITEPLHSLNQTIPPGTSVLVNLYSLHRDARQFPNPNRFMPERFFQRDNHQTTNRHPFAYIPFSAGPRNCIGQKLALMSVKVMLASIIKNYNIRSVDPEEKLSLLTEVILSNEKGINVVIQKR